MYLVEKKKLSVRVKVSRAPTRVNLRRADLLEGVEHLPGGTGPDVLGALALALHIGRLQLSPGIDAQTVWKIDALRLARQAGPV